MTVTIRSARPGDALAIATLRIASWGAAYRGIVPDARLDAMTPEKTIELWRATAAGENAGHGLVVSEAAGRLIGFAMLGPARAPDFGYSGEVQAIYLAPEAIGKGYGRPLFVRGLDWLAQQGHPDAILWVMEANARALRFYEKAGGVQVPGSRKPFSMGEREIWETAFGFRPLPVPTSSD